MTHLTKWENLPSLELYLDQVLLYVNQETAAYLQENAKPLTASMVNNYVKHGYLPRPEKKKYGKRQVARLIVLNICKSVFAISDIVQMIEEHYETAHSAQLYDSFLDCLEGQARPDTPELILIACQTIRSYRETMELVHQLKEGTNDESKL